MKVKMNKKLLGLLSAGIIGAPLMVPASAFAAEESVVVTEVDEEIKEVIDPVVDDTKEEVTITPAGSGEVVDDDENSGSEDTEDMAGVPVVLDDDTDIDDEDADTITWGVVYTGLPDDKIPGEAAFILPADASEAEITAAGSQFAVNIEGYKLVSQSIFDGNQLYFINYERILSADDLKDPNLPESSANWLYPNEWAPNKDDVDYGETMTCLHCGKEYVFLGNFQGACSDCMEKIFAPISGTPTVISIANKEEIDAIKASIKDPAFVPLCWTDKNGNKVMSPWFADFMEREGIEGVGNDPLELIRMLTSDDPYEVNTARLGLIRSGILYHGIEDENGNIWDCDLYINDGIWTSDPDLRGYEKVFGLFVPKVLDAEYGWSWNYDVWQSELVMVEVVDEKEPVIPEPTPAVEEDVIPQMGDEGMDPGVLVLGALASVAAAAAVRKRTTK